MAVTPLKTKFGKLLSDYLRNADIKQVDAAVRLGISSSAVSQMMHGKIVPDQQQLTIICELLALDYAQLFELNSMLSQIRTGAENLLSPFNHSLFALRCQRGLSIRQLANLSGVSADHIRVFETCFGALPLYDEADKLARVLGCSVTSLLQTTGVGNGTSEGTLSPIAPTPEYSLDEEAMEHAETPYRVERQVPQITLPDLKEYTCEDTIAQYARTHASKLLTCNDFQGRDIVLLQVTHRDLSLGIPGILMLVLADERPESHRELNLCRCADGRYFVMELRHGKPKEYRLSGTRRSIGETLWSIPILEFYFRPLKSGNGWEQQ